ncbi:MAG: pyruvate kinase [Prochlorococcaceae cyanobacterium]|jgi:pyruvate kinase
MTVADRCSPPSSAGDDDPLLAAAPDLAERLQGLLREMDSLEGEEGAALDRVALPYIAAARNLLDYLALRRRDLRVLQNQLAQLGLSSLGRCEASVRHTLECVLRIVRQVGGLPRSTPVHRPAVVDHGDGAEALARNACRLLGTQDDPSSASILVTLPAAAAADAALVAELLEAGMTIARINAAHDDEAVWEGMVRNVREASARTGRACRIAMDLAGPKLRTGPLQNGPAVVSAKPRRDACGRLLQPARVLLVPVRPGQTPAALAAPAGADAVLPVSGDGWRTLPPRTALRAIDASGRQRTLRVERIAPEGLWTTATHHWHFTPGLRLLVEKPRLELEIGALPSREASLLLRCGDHLRLTDADESGRPAERDAEGRLLRPAQIGCTLPEVFRHAAPGDRIAFDDGRIGGVILEADARSLLVEITRAADRGSRLRADQGINLPDTSLPLPALTPHDRAVLPFVALHADILSLSFVQRPQDVEDLQRLLLRAGRPDLGVILKIETRQAFENLPDLLLAAMASAAPLGVMIARGDLAIECGWERLAELQEEILRLCEAAHLPCIWATQVLDELAHHGLPTRAEISDVVLGARAEGVMLNKGPHIASTVRTLHRILQRMQGHQRKNRSLFRRLELATHHRAGVSRVPAPLAPPGDA